MIGTTLLLVATVLGPNAEAQERVDLELVLLADASRSIGDDEIRFQRRGYAAAITHPDVLAAIAYGYEQRIAVTYVEWGDQSSQEVVVPWSIIEGPDSAATFAEALRETPRLASGPNAIGSALAAAHALIDGNGINGTRKVIDFSADSAYSGGGVPVAQARSAALAAGIVINGLAILCRDCASGRPVDYDLESAFATFIVGGPGSFVITADGETRFAEAVRRKLLLEVAALPARSASAPILAQVRERDDGNPDPGPDGIVLGLIAAQLQRDPVRQLGDTKPCTELSDHIQSGIITPSPMEECRRP